MSRPTINEAIGMFQLSRQQPRVHVIDDIAEVLIEAATLVATFDPDVVLRDAVAAEIKKCQSYRCTCSSVVLVSAAVVAWWLEVERIEGESLIPLSAPKPERELLVDNEGADFDD